jgi:hypothetical protein
MEDGTDGNFLMWWVNRILWAWILLPMGVGLGIFHLYEDVRMNREDLRMDIPASIEGLDTRPIIVMEWDNG